MEKLKIKLENCYGIPSFEHEFDFSSKKDPKKGPKKDPAKVYAVYAPNGLMKTSFAKTFDKIAKGEAPQEERHNRKTKFSVLKDGTTIDTREIYVLKSEIDLREESPAVTNILVNPEHKQKYDKIIGELETAKTKVLNALQKASKVKKADVEKTVLKDWNEKSFIDCIEKILRQNIRDDLSIFKYATIFDPSVEEILKSNEFIESSVNFNKRYQELFSQAGSIYQKGVFNPARADASFNALDKNGFFTTGHKVHLKGEKSSITKSELDEKLKIINASIDGDEALKKLREQLAKNAQTQALTSLIESIEISQIEILLKNLKPTNIAQFRKNLWATYLRDNTDAKSLIELSEKHRKELDEIDAAAATAAPQWTEAIELFNDRFVDMPFTLSVANQKEAALGKEKAKLLFTFKDGECVRSLHREEITTLSQGEKRALYLLNFIFEVEERINSNQETLFIIDDVADSFDYKNKHAIVQYLKDVTRHAHFHQIILTHNYDFFRTLANNIVHRDRCLMANRENSSIKLVKAEGIKNYFIGKWKEKVGGNERILCASIPFTRNIIEYTKSDKDPDYLMLTSLLHWKEQTETITVGEYFKVYNDTFGSEHPTDSKKTIYDLISQQAEEISRQQTHDGLNLEDKVLLSIEIRLQAEKFLTNELRTLKNNPNFWCQEENQFGVLIEDYSSTKGPDKVSMRTLEKVSITVSSNIHLNSFMYEPILDLSIGHLIKLYKEVLALNTRPQR